MYRHDIDGSTESTPLIQGTRVTLNPNWVGYPFLKKEFGDKFPCRVREVSGDIIRVSETLTFARHVLAMA